MTVVIGIDPGTAHIGWCKLDRGQWSEAGTIGGKDLEEAATQLLILTMHNLGCLVGVEHVARRFVRPSQAQELVQTADGAGFIRGYLRGRIGRNVHAVSPYDWRKWLAGNPTATDAQIKHALEHVRPVGGMPKRSNKHVRDACGIAAYLYSLNEKEG